MPDCSRVVAFFESCVSLRLAYFLSFGIYMDDMVEDTFSFSAWAFGLAIKADGKARFVEHVM